MRLSNSGRVPLPPWAWEVSVSTGASGQKTAHHRHGFLAHAQDRAQVLLRLRQLFLIGLPYLAQAGHAGLDLGFRQIVRDGLAERLLLGTVAKSTATAAAAIAI